MTAFFIVGLAVPSIIPVGSLNLSVYRLVSLVAFVPCLLAWAGGRAGRVRIADLAVLLLSAWAGLSLLHAHGVSGGLQPAGMFAIETVGAYFLARCAIRDAASFRSMVLLSAKVVILLLPFALYEAVSGSKPLLSAFGLFLPTVEATYMPRSGFWRVQGPFNHSILYGAFCASILALAWSVSDRGRLSLRSGTLMVLIALAAALSLSSAPIAALFIQLGLILWGTVLSGVTFRWKILWLGAFVAYLVVEFGSNQTPVQFYISRFTFDQQTGWYRTWIWEHGSASVASHPLLGIGLNDWARPKWMPSDTVDNFWLLTAMRYGLPAIILISTAFIWTFLAVSARKLRDPQLDAYRTGYLICMAALAFVGSTVHFTGPSYAWFMFLIGSGAWFLEAKETVPAQETGARARSSRRQGARTGSEQMPTRRGYPRTDDGAGR